MRELEIIEAISKNDNILSLPQSISEVLAEIGREDFSPERLSKIVLKDPGLTGRLLRIANSPFYQRFGQIKTVHQAVSALGVTTVKCLVLSSSVFQPGKVAKESGIDPKAFFSYSLTAATAAEKIATCANFQSAEEAFIAGLLHDIGILYLVHRYPAEYRKVLDLSRNFPTLVDAERHVFGVDHCRVGSLLCETWRLPGYISASVAKHHNLSESEGEGTLERIVRLAVLLTSDHFSGFSADLEDRLLRIGKLSDQLSLTKEQVDSVSRSLPTAAMETAGYLGVDIGNLDEMLVRSNDEIWKSYLVVENLFKERQELSKNLLDEARARGAIQTKNIAMATLSHYINNALMAVSGRMQLMRLQVQKGNTEKLLEQFPGNMEVVERSLRKIVAVLEEMKEISPIDQVEFYTMSEAMNIDTRIEARMKTMTTESGLVLPEEAMF